MLVVHIIDKCNEGIISQGCIVVGHGAENVSWILFLHRVENGIVDYTLKERSSYSWLGPGGVWY